MYKSYETFRADQTVQSFENLLKLLNSILNSKTLNAYMIISIGPYIIRDLTQFYRRILIEYKTYFKTNELGL